MKFKTALGMILSLISTTIGASQVGKELTQLASVFTEVPAKSLEITNAPINLTSSEKKLQKSIETYDLRLMCLIKNQDKDLALKVKELLKSLESSQYVYEGL